MSNSNQSDLEESLLKIAGVISSIGRMRILLDAAASPAAKEIIINTLTVSIDECSRLINEHMRIQRRIEEES